MAALVLVGSVSGPAMAAVSTGTQTTGAQTSTNDHLEPNDTPADASELLRDHGELQIVNGESDYFEVHLQQGEELAASIDFSHSQGDLDLLALAPNGTIIDSSISMSDGERVSFTAPEDGTYHVQVYGYMSASAPYYIGASIENNDRFEDNDDFGDATQMPTGYHEDMRVHNGESDFYAVNLSSGTTLDAAIEFDHGTGDLDMRVYGPNQGFVGGSYSVTDDESMSVTASQTGIHYVEVYGFSGASAPYNLTLSSPDAAKDDDLEDNDAWGSATPVDQFRYENLQVTANDEDWYSIHLDRGEQLRTELQFDHAVGDLDVTVYDPGMNYVDSSTSITDGELVTATAQQSGTYYVQIEGYSGATNAYDLAIWANNDRLEYNNGITSATSVSVRDHDNLRIENGESDYVAVHLDQGDQLNASAAFDHSTGDLDMAVYGPNQNEIGSSWSTTDDESVVITAQSAGTYYVEVYGFSGATAPYDLLLEEN